MADDPYAEFEAYRKGYETLAGSSIGTPEEEAERGARRRATEAAGQRYQSMGPRRRGMAGVRNIVGNIPIVRNLPGVSGFANPPGGSEAALDLEDARTARPVLSGVERFVGGVGPYAGAASFAPKLLYGNLPRAMASNASIGGTDEYMAGGNPAIGAGRDALATIPGAVAGRIFAPRAQEAARATRQEFHSRGASTAEEGVDEAVSALNNITAANLRTHPSAPMRPRGEGGIFTRRGSSSEAADSFLTQEERLRQRIAELERIRSQGPTMTVPQIGDPASGKLENTIRDATQGAVLAMLGAGAGQSAGMNPMWPAALGMAAPMVSRHVVNRTNQGIANFNRNFLGENSPKLPRRIIWEILNNPLLSDQNRSMLRAISAPATTEAGDDLGGAVAPWMIDSLARPLGGR